MATQIVILNGDSIKIDDVFHIRWTDKGAAMPAIPNTVHAVIWNNLAGQNEIQNKDASTGNMTGNTSLSATTVAALLTWAETRKGEIETAQTAFNAAREAGTDSDGETWRDYL